MRIFVPIIPGIGLMLPVLPLVWALRAAGHEVLVGANAGACRTVANAGLPVVDVLPDADVWTELTGKVGSSELAESKTGPFGWLSESLADGVVRVGERYRPDLVLSTPELGSALILGERLDVPVVQQSVRAAWAGMGAMAEPMLDLMSGVSRRLGGTGDLPDPAAVIDVRPPSIGGGTDPTHWLMRYTPFNGSAVLPEWVIEPAERRRICVTLGSVVPLIGGLPAIADLVRALAELDLEVILALGDIDLAELGELPPNVRAVGWLPLHALLPSCAAIVHHAGAGTCLTPMVYGVPQLALPYFADNPWNAQVVADRGVGLMHDPKDTAVETLVTSVKRLLDEPEFGTAAAEVRDEIAAQPPATQIAARIAALG